MRESGFLFQWGGVSLPSQAAALLLLCAALGLFLTAINAATREVIRAGEQERWQQALETVMPGAESFSETWFDHSRADNVLAAFTKSELKGYCVVVTTRGFGGPMELLVGVDVYGSVTGVLILEENETPEMGAEARSHTFLDQFLGKSGTVRVNQGGNAVEAVSGATITSRAVTDGVNAALSAVAALHMEGGEIGEEGEV